MVYVYRRISAIHSSNGLYMKQITTVLFGLAFVFVVPVSAHAAQWTYDTQSMSLQERIQMLYELVADLQAELAAQQGGSYYTGSGAIKVATQNVSRVEEASARLHGSVRLTNAPWGYVWFQYGEDRSFDERSPRARASGGYEYTYRADIYNLDEGEQYYYRAVGEDPNGRLSYGVTRTFTTDGYRSDRDNDDEPDVETDRASGVDEDSAYLEGEVDMNDFRNGEVFFVYGEDEDQVEDVEDDFDSYYDVDEDGDDLQKVRVDRDLDDEDDYRERVDDLDEDERYYFQICVAYEDDDDDDVITCGGVEEFETDRNGGSSNDDEPDVRTEDAENIEEDEAELRGEVDMNDFDNGIVFFVYGEDEDQVEDTEDDYDSYGEIDEDRGEYEKTRMDTDLDGSASYELRIYGLDDDTDYYYQICVEYDDEDNDETLMCGGVEEFTTDRD